MDWKTSNHMDGSEIRDSIGLQYFAEDGNTSDTGADMDGFDESEFLAALEGSDAEDQRGTNEETRKTCRTVRKTSAPKSSPRSRRISRRRTAKHRRKRWNSRYRPYRSSTTDSDPAAGRRSAVLTGALGANPVELLQKGMNYDRKAEREMRVLDQYAEAAGMNRQQYLEQLESARNEQLLSAEIEQCRTEFPDTPDAALKAIAEGRMASQRAAAAQAAEQQRAQLDAMQQRIDQTVAQARQEANEKAWDEYEVLAGVHKPEDIPPRVMELVNSEGMTPVAAHWRYQAEQNQQAVRIAEKNQTNRQTSPGSVAGNGNDTSDPFLKGFLGL
ncbi:MAG: hypothetical protein ACLRVN_01375 [Butyricicoccus sp.]